MDQLTKSIGSQYVLYVNVHEYNSRIAYIGEKLGVYPAKNF